MASSARTSVDQADHLELPATTSSPHSLSRAVHARRAEYTRPQKIKIKIGSWNVAACPGAERDLGAWFVEGKGIDKRLAGLKIGESIANNGSQDHVESVADQEQRQTKKASTVPKGDEGVIAGGAEIGIYVLGLQEVVDLNDARKYIGRIYTDPEPSAKWRKALKDAIPPGYIIVAEQQLSGIMLFVCASPTVAPTITSVSTVPVGTGIMGYLGNKGAVSTRIVLGETTRLVFTNCHLASGSDPAHLERRCWDVTQILQRTTFEPINWAGVLDDAGEGIGEEDFAFWFGDLNFRLDGLPGDDIRRLLMLHAKGEYDVGSKTRDNIEEEVAGGSPIIVRHIDSDSESEDESEQTPSSTFDKSDDASSETLPDPDDFVHDPSQDPASLQATLDSLLPHDQLRQVQKQKKAFHDGWREGQISFLPTYKYDVGTMGIFDSSEKKRAPSWCDRILFRTRKDKIDYENQIREAALARIKDEEMKARGIDQAGDDESVLFDYDPEEDGLEDELPITKPVKVMVDDYNEYDDAEGDTPDRVVTKEGYVDRIHLDVYTSHQRVLSSDHKPLNAVFSLEYDAVVPELKAQIQQEVARELDRAENEGRPTITIVVDHSSEDQPKTHGQSSVSGSGLDFGEISFLRRKAQSLTIANTGQVPATFAFVDRPSATAGEPDRIGPTWVSVTFTEIQDNDTPHPNTNDAKREITLSPGDAVNATISLFISDISLIPSLNNSKAQLDDVLVLRITDGRDHFIPLHANWLQSCLYRSVPELIRVPEGGVRALLPSRDGSGVHVNRGQDVCWSAPRELFKLTAAIESLIERVIADSSMLSHAQIPSESSGWPFDPKSWILTSADARETHKASVLEALDSDQDLLVSLAPEVPAIEKLEIIAEILLLFLSTLTDGIIPAPLFAKLEADIVTRGTKQLSDPEEIKAWVLDVLSVEPNHNISFVFLMSVLGKLVLELCPVPAIIPSAAPLAEVPSTKRSSMDTVRRSLSWKGRPPPGLDAITTATPGIGNGATGSGAAGASLGPVKARGMDRESQKRRMKERAYAEVFRDVVIRGPSEGLEGIGGKSVREKKVVEERKGAVLEGVLRCGL